MSEFKEDMRLVVNLKLINSEDNLKNISQNYHFKIKKRLFKI